jgi:polyisoprenoid-binding protein YceI
MKLPEKAIRRVRAACAILTLGLLPQAVALAAAPANWRIDPERTHIAFAIDSVGYPRTHGQFRQFSGRISVDLDHPDRSSVTFHVQSQSVDVGSQQFDDYLRSTAFLDAAQFPSIDFVSKSVAKIDDRTVRVTGDLTLLGVTRPLSVEVAVQRQTGAGARLTFLAKTSIDRLAFGMNSGFPLVSREVELAISSEAVEL